MKSKNDKHLGLRIDAQLHHKLSYIADYEGRSINGQLIYLVRQCIRKFESENGVIDYESVADENN